MSDSEAAELTPLWKGFAGSIAGSLQQRLEHLQETRDVADWLEVPLMPYLCPALNPPPPPQRSLVSARSGANNPPGD